MTVLPTPFPLILETAIAAQMLLFAGVQVAGVGRFCPLRGVLVLVTGCLGLAVALNTLASMGAVPELRDLNLFLELACAAAIYLYVAHAHDGGSRLTLPMATHFAPAAGVFLAWETGLVRHIDVVMLAILSAYAAMTVAAAWRHRRYYRPRQLARFVALLTVNLFLVTMLRAAMMYEADLGIALRDSGGYMALLAIMLVLSSSVLLVELRHPNLLGGPHVVSGPTANPPTAAELQILDGRFREMMARDKPYLDPEVTVAGVAAKLGIPARQLSHLASARYAKTVPALFNEWRVDEAARMLADPQNDRPITTIMFDAGFGSKSAFQREFDRRFGVTPTAYRKQARDAASAPGRSPQAMASGSHCRGAATAIDERAGSGVGVKIE